jgi:hypothetical protein
MQHTFIEPGATSTFFEEVYKQIIIAMKRKVTFVLYRPGMAGKNFLEKAV